MTVCEGCGDGGRLVAWAYAWGRWLCADCREWYTAFTLNEHFNRAQVRHAKQIRFPGAASLVVDRD